MDFTSLAQIIIGTGHALVPKSRHLSLAAIADDSKIKFSGSRVIVGFGCGGLKKENLMVSYNFLANKNLSMIESNGQLFIYVHKARISFQS